MTPIFSADSNPETVNYTLSCIKGKIPFFPVSTRSLILPEVELPNSGFLLATSGSTGIAKMAHLTLENLDCMAKFPHPDLHLTPNDSYLLSVPLYHISGLSVIYRCHMSGAAIIYPGSGKDHEVTHVSFVPTQLKRFLQNPSIYPKLKAILLGGASIPIELCMKAYQLGLPLYITYGMTEMTSQIATTEFDPKKGIVFGDPLPEREIKIVDGEIHVRGKTLFQGYYKTETPFIDGWFPTKDLGIIHPNGLELIGRKDRMLISGGENIHPEELELTLLSHPQIIRAKVSHREDSEYGQRPIARVISELSNEAIRSYLLERLPKFKVPSLRDILVMPLESEFFSEYFSK